MLNGNRIGNLVDTLAHQSCGPQHDITALTGRYLTPDTEPIFRSIQRVIKIFNRCNRHPADLNLVRWIHDGQRVFGLAPPAAYKK